jgi:hypothetical protein
VRARAHEREQPDVAREIEERAEIVPRVTLPEVVLAGRHLVHLPGHVGLDDREAEGARLGEGRLPCVALEPPVVHRAAEERHLALGPAPGQMERAVLEPHADAALRDTATRLGPGRRSA